jgi:segregation and condensation protein A
LSEPIEEPVEILVQMAERGEIDPWNIDIVEVTDRFLSELDRRKELDLRVSGRTLFYAAILLRMKSEYLEQVAISAGGEPDELEEVDDFSLDDELEGASGRGPIDRLEREIRRRLERKHLRKRPITLYELIAELRFVEREEQRRQRMKRPEPEHLATAEEVVSIAHDEGYLEASVTVLSTWDGDGEITIHALAALLGWPVPDVYIPLLFLMSEGKIALRQEEFFGEVYIGREPEAAPGQQAT